MREQQPQRIEAQKKEKRDLPVAPVSRLDRLLINVRQILRNPLVRGVCTLSMAALLVACGGGEENPLAAVATEPTKPPITAREVTATPENSAQEPTVYEAKVTTESHEFAMQESEAFALPSTARQLVNVPNGEIHYYVSPTTTIQLEVSELDARYHDMAHEPYIAEGLGGMIVVPKSVEVTTVTTSNPEKVVTSGGTSIVYGKPTVQEVEIITSIAVFPYPHLVNDRLYPYNPNQTWSDPSKMPVYFYGDRNLHSDVVTAEFPENFGIFRGVGEVQNSETPTTVSDVYTYLGQEQRGNRTYLSLQDLRGMNVLLFIDPENSGVFESAQTMEIGSNYDVTWTHQSLFPENFEIFRVVGEVQNSETPTTVSDVYTYLGQEQRGNRTYLSLQDLRGMNVLLFIDPENSGVFESAQTMEIGSNYDVTWTHQSSYLDIDAEKVAEVTSNGNSRQVYKIGVGFTSVTAFEATPVLASNE